MATNQIERIEEMERRLDLIQEVAGEISQALDRYAEVQSEIKALDNYYGSEEWRQDYDDDIDGKLPDNLKRGVLSEDGIWNALAEVQEINRRLSNFVQTIDKQ